jgi:hypothetical protein
MDLMFRRRGETTMKLTTILLAVTIPFVANGQAPKVYDGVMSEGRTSGKQMTAAEFRLLTVEHILSSGSPLKIGAVQLHRMGDDLAVNLIKATAKSGKLTPGQTNTALEMIETAFERPESILSAADRSPRATVSLLRTLALSSDNSAAKDRIDTLLKRFEPMVK